MGTSQNAALAVGVNTPPPISPHRYRLRLSTFCERPYLASKHTPHILYTSSQQALCLTKLALENLITPKNSLLHTSPVNSTTIAAIGHWTLARLPRIVPNHSMLSFTKSPPQTAPTLSRPKPVR